ncbi:MAG: GDSL-type esterase/lipase family protein, partial [Pseudomonadota bacterium]
EGVTCAAPQCNGEPDPSTGNRIGYRKRLKDLMTNNGYSIDLVGTRNAAAPDLDSDPSNGDPNGGYGYNRFDDFESEGHGGKKSEYFRDNTLSASTWLTPSDPVIVLLHVGTNDFQSDNSPPPIVDYVVDTVNNIFSYRSQARVYVARIIGQHPENLRNVSSSDVDDFNDAVVSAVTAISNRVHIVDQFNGIDYSTTGTANPDFGDTNVHPSTSAYNRMASRWYNSLRNSGMFERCP